MARNRQAANAARLMTCGYLVEVIRSHQIDGRVKTSNEFPTIFLLFENFFSWIFGEPDEPENLPMYPLTGHCVRECGVCVFSCRAGQADHPYAIYA